MVRILTLVAALTLAGAPAAIAQLTPVADVSGQIIRIEPEQQVVVLGKGQMYRVTPNTTISVGSQPVAFGGLRAGQSVMIRAGEPVTLQNGQYVVIGQAPASSPSITVAPPAAAPPGSTVVVAPPAAAVPVGVRQTVYGRVDDVDNDGTVKIDLGEDSFKVRLSRERARQLREGDRVQIDMTLVPPGTPAASPR